MGLLTSFACSSLWGQVPLERFPSRLLARDVPIAIHQPAAATVAAWQKAHPGDRLRLVLFLPGYFDGPADLHKRGIFAELDRREAEGTLAPAVWVAVTHYHAWYMDALDGSFPYRRFLLEELLPEVERRFPGFGGRADARTVAGLSMGGLAALNFAATTPLFHRCAAISPALLEPPFKKAGFFLRPGIRKAFPSDPEAFAPWNPWRHRGGDAELLLGSGLQDKYGLGKATEELATLCRRPGRAVRLKLREGGHDWDTFTPAFLEFAEEINRPGPLAVEPLGSPGPSAMQ
ncbi:MAG TPA: alpha/beta hydrolase-fold protein [Holophagaceae bacterium]|nr:alpha/beta hydrolase-fold protein [Holophagaceae bacterium]